jgi:hypothetical protein
VPAAPYFIRIGWLPYMEFETVTALVQIRFLSDHCLNAFSASRFNSATSSGSGSSLKLKHVFRCIRFLSAPEMLLAEFRAHAERHQMQAYV